MMAHSGVLDVAALYSHWRPQVMRWLRRMGCPESDVEDLVQDVFIVVNRKLPGYRDDNLAGWLYWITRKTLAGHRRRARVWLLLTYRHEIVPDLRDDVQPTPDMLFERRQAIELSLRV